MTHRRDGRSTTAWEWIVGLCVAAFGVWMLAATAVGTWRVHDGHALDAAAASAP